MIKSNTYYLTLIAFAVLFFAMQSCVKTGDWQNVKQLQNDTVYPEKATGVEINITDSGHRIAQIHSPLMERYSGKNPYLEMKKGVRALFFNKQGVKENQLDANYAISHENEKIIEVRNDVRLENVKGERLNTEKLTWNQASKKIYTDQFVKITTPDEVIYGDGFESNQNFTEYKIFKIRGILSLKDVKTDSSTHVDSIH
jgi:LPS export ABC transporter protein LptC